MFGLVAILVEDLWKVRVAEEHLDSDRSLGGKEIVPDKS